MPVATDAFIGYCRLLRRWSCRAATTTFTTSERLMWRALKALYDPRISVGDIVAILTFDHHPVAFIKVAAIGKFPIVVVTAVVGTTGVSGAAFSACTFAQRVARNSFAYLSGGIVVEVAAIDRKAVCGKANNR